VALKLNKNRNKKNGLKKKLFSKTYKMATIENVQINQEKSKRVQKRIDPEQLKENNRKAKYRWFLENKDTYFKQGGHGYDAQKIKIKCQCGRVVVKKDLCRHSRTSIHCRLISKNENLQN